MSFATKFIFETKFIAIGKFALRGARSRLFSSHCSTATRNLNQFYRFYIHKLGGFSVDVSNTEINMCDLNLHNQGEGAFEDEHSENQAGCMSTDHDQSSDFGLNRLFDMEEVVKNVKIKLKKKREDRKMQENVCNKQKNIRKKWEDRKKSKNSDQCSLKDNKSDSDSSFGLTTLFEQKKEGHKRQRKAKKGNKIVKKIKEVDSYGLEWLFSEKYVSDKRNKRKSRKKRMMDYDDSEEDERNEVIKIKKKRPNHFVAIRVSDSKIHLAIKEIQDAVLKENEKLKPALIPLILLHITIAVMHLDETTIKIAKDSLEKCKDKITEALKAVNFKLTFSGVGNFNNQVVFAKLQEKEQIECLKTINSVITATFEKDGICLSDKREYNPHLTLLKLSRKSSLRKSGIKKVEENAYAFLVDSYFGEDLVQNVYLCSMQGAKEDDGFYKCLSTITFSNSSDMSESKNDK